MSQGYLSSLHWLTSQVGSGLCPGLLVLLLPPPLPPSFLPVFGTDMLPSEEHERCGEPNLLKDFLSLTVVSGPGLAEGGHASSV